MSLFGHVLTLIKHDVKISFLQLLH